MPKNLSLQSEAVDPLPALVEGRFRLLTVRRTVHYPIVDQTFERRVDEAKRRARRLDEQIVRTVATSKSGLLAQVRLLGLFYAESTNGAGRRGSLLMETIATGIERLGTSNPVDRSDRNTQKTARSSRTRKPRDTMSSQQWRRPLTNYKEINPSSTMRT